MSIADGFRDIVVRSFGVPPEAAALRGRTGTLGQGRSAGGGGAAGAGPVFYNIGHGPGFLLHPNTESRQAALIAIPDEILLLAGFQPVDRLFRDF